MILFFTQVQSMISAAAQKKICQRSSKSELFAPDPVTPEDFDTIPEKYTKTEDGIPFLLKNMEVQSGRLMMFSTADNIKRLSVSKVWMMDGTFDTAPGNFKQIYTLQGCIGDRFLPLVYFFLPCKTEKCYTEALEELMDFAGEIGVTLEPELVITDFEKAVINAVATLFRTVKQQGCFFHWTQNLFKRIQKCGLSGDFSNDKNVYMQFKKAEALAFVPPNSVAQAFECVKNGSPLSMQNFFKYLEDNYVLGPVKRTLKNGTIIRNRPTFEVPFWNVYEVTKNNQPRTTNRLEGWHNRWRTAAGSAGGLYAVIMELQKEQKQTEGEVLRMLQGSPAAKRNGKQIEKDAKLFNATETFENSTLEDYILSVALILKE